MRRLINYADTRKIPRFAYVLVQLTPESMTLFQMYFCAKKNTWAQCMLMNPNPNLTTHKLNPNKPTNAPASTHHPIIPNSNDPSLSGQKVNAWPCPLIYVSTSIYAPTREYTRNYIDLGSSPNSYTLIFCSRGPLLTHQWMAHSFCSSVVQRGFCDRSRSVWDQFALQLSFI